MAACRFTYLPLQVTNLVLDASDKLLAMGCGQPAGHEFYRTCQPAFSCFLVTFGGLLHNCSQVTYLVLDEADKLLAMGFTEQVDALLAAASSGAITRAFFSATLPEKVRRIFCMIAQ